ncbi:hypothetical protein Tco_0266311 [Tanacetum coccineum]
MVVLMLSYSIKVMDPNSSLGKVCLGENVVVISSDKMDTEEVSDRFVAPCFVNRLEAYDREINLGFIINPNEDDVEPGVILGRSFLQKSLDDWDHLLDFNLDEVPLLGEEELSPFVCKMGKSNRNKKRAMENLNIFYQDIGTSSLAGSHLTQEEAVKEALAIKMSQKFALLEEKRPIIYTMAYHDKYKKILDEILKDKVELDGKIVKEEEESVKRIKGEVLKEKDDHKAFIFPIRLEGQVGVTTLIAKFLILDIPINRDAPIVVGRGFLRMIGGIVNTPERLFLTFDGFCHQTFRAARSDVMRNAESNSNEEEEYQINRNKFGAPIYGSKPTPYLNYNDPAERSLAIQTVTKPFWKISVWKKAVSFLGSLLVPLKHVNWKPDYKGCYTKEEEAT